jgi:hypothetical protein
MKHPVLAVMTTALAVGCISDRIPTRPAGRPNAEIFDAAHSSGTPHFFFLPPMVPMPTTTGAFNRFLAPAVVICEVDLSTVDGCVAGTPFHTFVFGTGSGAVRVDPTGEQYVVNWDTQVFVPDPNKTYRVNVFVNATRLGFADVGVIVSAKEAKSFATGDSIPLVDGRTLPIKFRIEFGALCAAHASDCAQATVTQAGGTFITGDALAGVLIPPNALPPGVTQVALTIEQIPHPGVFAPGAGPLPTTLEQFPFFFDFSTQPVIRFVKQVTVQVCQIADVNNTDPFYPPPQLHDQLVLAHPQPGNPSTIEVLPRRALFFGCGQPTIGSRPSGTSWMALARTPWGRVLGGMIAAGERAFAPQVLHASVLVIHTGVGGGTCCFSPINAVLVGMTNNSPTLQQAPAGTNVPTPPSVIIRDTITGMPTSGVPVTFAVAAGGGTISDGTTSGSSIVVSTNGAGIASLASWTIGPDSNVVTASAGVSGSPVVFTAIGLPAIFTATFTSDAVGASPGPPEIGTWSLSNPDGTILVQAAVGNLTSKPVELTQLGQAAGSVKLFGTVTGTPPTTGIYVARWRSLVHSANVCFNGVVLRDAGSLILADLDYRPGGQLTYNSNSANVTVGTWAQDVAQLFEITIDLDNHVTSLSIDGVPVTGAQGLAFSDPTGTPANVAHINMELGCIAAQDYAWDDITITRR